MRMLGDSFPSHHPHPHLRRVRGASLPVFSQSMLNRRNCLLADDNIWFAPEVPTRPDPMNGGLRQYIRPLSGTAMVPGHDGLRTPRSS